MPRHVADAAVTATRRRRFGDGAQSNVVFAPQREIILGGHSLGNTLERHKEKVHVNNFKFFTTLKLWYPSNCLCKRCIQIFGVTVFCHHGWTDDQKAESCTHCINWYWKKMLEGFVSCFSTLRSRDLSESWSSRKSSMLISSPAGSRADSANSICFFDD